MVQIQRQKMTVIVMLSAALAHIVLCDRNNLAFQNNGYILI